MAALQGFSVSELYELFIRRRRRGSSRAALIQTDGLCFCGGGDFAGCIVCQGSLEGNAARALSSRAVADIARGALAFPLPQRSLPVRGGERLVPGVLPKPGGSTTRLSGGAPVCVCVCVRVLGRMCVGRNTLMSPVLSQAL